MKQLFLFLVIFISYRGYTQSIDFIILKKGNQTVATYFAGRSIKFTTNTGAQVEADIAGIKNDSLFLKEYLIRQVPTQLGVYILDTSTYFTQYYYKDIKAIEKSGRHFDWN